MTYTCPPSSFERPKPLATHTFLGDLKGIWEERGSVSGVAWSRPFLGRRGRAKQGFCWLQQDPYLGQG